MSYQSQGPAAVLNLTAAREKERRLYPWAISMLTLLIAGTLVYPDTFVDAGWRAGPFRISPLAILFAFSAPVILSYAWSSRHMLSLRAMDVILFTYMGFIALRGAAAAGTGNEIGLVLAFAGYILVVYYGAAVLTRKEKGLRILFAAIVAPAIIAAIYGLAEFVMQNNFLYGDIIKESVKPFAGNWRNPANYYRIGSLLGQPVAMGTFMVQSIPFIVFFFIRSSTNWIRAAWGSAAVIVLLALLVTFSKGAWATAFLLILAGMVWLILRRPPATRHLLLLLAALILVSGVFAAIFYSTMRAGTFSRASTRESVAPRSYMWSKVPATFTANPIIGAGLWQGRAEIYRVYPAPERENQPTAIDNIYLSVIVEQGVLGLILLLAILFLLTLQIRNVIRKGKRLAAWVFPVGACMAVTLVNGLTFDALIVWPIMVVFWLSAGITRSLEEQIGTE